MAKPELGTKRLCPNCGAKYYDLNRDPIICPKCNALFATGLVQVAPATAAPEDAEGEIETEDSSVEFVALEEADEPDPDEETGDIDGNTDDVPVEPDDAALIDDNDDEEVSDVVRGSDQDEEER